MLITFKTLQQKTFKIEINETEKVKALKEKIEAEKGSNEFPVEGQKLIYAGKILDDDKIISEYSIDAEKNFVVVMAVKPKTKTAEKPKEASEATSSTSTATTTPPAQTPSTASASETTAETTTTTTTSSSAETASVEAAESALLTGSALETSITELMSLGYSREQVMRALNSSFHNADRAAEYLLSGNIPDIGGDDAPAAEGEQQAQPPATDSSPASGGGVPDISFLASLPQFQLMRNQVRQHPETLPQLLQEIGQSNPQLLQLISQNQQRFIDLLNAPDDPAQEQGGGGVGGGGAGGGFQIQVTQEEKAAIDRIVAMGFPESEVIQAFFACEKNEQLTINFLLSQ